jgi:uncharacterized membrane protein YiaA
MRTAITLTGILILVVGAIVEVIGVFYATSILLHNAYGFAGGILALFGIIAISQGIRNPPGPAQSIQKKAVLSHR